MTAEFDRRGYNDVTVLIRMSKQGQLAQIAEEVQMKPGHKAKFVKDCLHVATGSRPSGFIVSKK